MGENFRIRDASYTFTRTWAAIHFVSEVWGTRLSGASPRGSGFGVWGFEFRCPEPGTPNRTQRLKIRTENLPQETFDLDVRFEGTNGMFDESLVEKVQARGLFFCVAQDRFSPGEADCGLAVFARYDSHYPPNWRLDR